MAESIKVIKVTSGKRAAVVPAIVKTDDRILNDIRLLIDSARGRVATYVNAELTMLYWHVGERIQRDTLKEKRAEYGQEILATLSRQLVLDYGKGFDLKNLWRMVQFVECFSKEEIVVTLSRQLSWSHFIELIPVKNALARDFYAEMCRIERWSVRTLREKIDGMLFERTTISKRPDSLILMELKQLREEDKLTSDLVFRDPYFLDFLGLKGAFQEKDVEAAILREIESFILELGVGFSFIARQKRIVIDGEDHYIDLLFYHRLLRRLIVIELKLGKFKAEHKGQMELYLRWLEKHEVNPGEEAPLGLILCASKSDEKVELLQLGKGGIRVAQYLMELPSKDILEKKLHQAIGEAQARLSLYQLDQKGNDHGDKK